MEVFYQALYNLISSVFIGAPSWVFEYVIPIFITIIILGFFIFLIWLLVSFPLTIIKINKKVDNEKELTNGLIKDENNERKNKSKRRFY
jgi:hypothetical protein